MSGQRQPTKLVVMRGKKHFTKQEVNTRLNSEVTAPADGIYPPAYLLKKQKEEFCDIAQQLIDIEIMSNLDCDTLAMFIIAKSDYVKFVKLGRKEKDLDKIDQVMKLKDRAFRQCRNAASDLGLTISSRCKLIIPKAPENENKSKWDKYKHGG